MKKLIIFSLLFFVGCASAPDRKTMEKALAGYELPHKPKDGEGVVYIVRPSSFGGLVRFNVFLDEHEEPNEMGWNRGSQYIYFFAPEGKHKIWSVAENNAEMEFTVKKSEPIFIKQNAEFGILFARNSLESLGPLEGKYWIKKLNSGEVIKTRLGDSPLK